MIINKEVTCIIINSDASYNSTAKIGGYAFYIKSDLFTIKKSGVFKTPLNNAEEAEIMAIGNAIALLLAKEDLPKAKWLIINSDCLNGSNKIRTSRTELGKRVNILRQKLINRLSSSKNKIRHVKAHNGTPDARSWVNDWCDKESRKCMREEVKRINSLKINVDN